MSFVLLPHVLHALRVTEERLPAFRAPGLGGLPTPLTHPRPERTRAGRRAGTCLTSDTLLGLLMTRQGGTRLGLAERPSPDSYRGFQREGCTEIRAVRILKVCG